MIKRQYSAAEREFVFQWADRWFQLVNLIYDLIRNDRSPTSPPPPTELDEINYQGLHFWFIEHEEQFKQLWKDFYQSQNWALHPGDEELADIPDVDKYLENPFFSCYRPKNLYRLVRELDIQSGIDLWEPSENRAWTAAIELFQMDKRVVEFYEWICDREEDTV
ncbi:MAG: hypothetical protein ACFFCW_08795 [Candidatus Hodarchaeota archaeon]